MATLCSVGDITPRQISVKPVVLDDFFVHRNRKVTIGRENHKYLNEDCLNSQTVRFDLHKGYSTYDPRPLDEGLDQILQYLILAADRQGTRSLKDVTDNADVVCYRGALTTLAASYYEKGGDGWMFVVEKFGGVCFIRELDTDAALHWRANCSEAAKLGTYAGHKFETFIFAEKGKNPTPNEPVSTWDTMYAAFAATFPGSPTETELKLMYAGEIDGLDSHGRHVEVKTQADKLFNNRYFEQKAMKWFIQNKIVGIDDLIIGFKNREGIVSRCEKVNLENLNRQCRTWNADISFRAAQHILNTVCEKYDRLVKPGELLVIERQPDMKTIQYRTVPATSHPVLTEEFKARFDKY